MNHQQLSPSQMFLFPSSLSYLHSLLSFLPLTYSFHHLNLNIIKLWWIINNCHLRKCSCSLPLSSLSYLCSLLILPFHLLFHSISLNLNDESKTIVTFANVPIPSTNRHICMMFLFNTVTLGLSQFTVCLGGGLTSLSANSRLRFIDGLGFNWDTSFTDVTRSKDERYSSINILRWKKRNLKNKYIHVLTF